MALTLRAVDVSGPTRWRWELSDGSRAVAVHEVELDPSTVEYAAFEDLYGYLRRSPGTDPIAAGAGLVERVGAWAGEHVLGSAIGAVLAGYDGQTVRVEIPAGAEFMLDRPLELSHVDGRPLVRRDVALVYTWTGDRPAGKEPVGDRLRILALFSMPSRQSVLALRRERYELARLIGEVTDRAVELRVLQYGVTRERLARTAEEHPGWDVLHVAAHGTHGALVLETADGRADEVSTVDLVALLRPARHRLKLAVLGSCHSGADTAVRALRRMRLDDQADKLAERGDGTGEGTTVGLARGLVEQLGVAVVAMRYPVEDRFAIALTNELYPRLLEGQLVDRAAARAVAAAAGTGPSLYRPALSLGTPAVFGSRAAGLDLRPPNAPTDMNAFSLRMTGFPAEPVRFVGRTPAMVAASGALAPRSGRTAVVFVGMAGAGKTTCALELAYQHASAFGALAWWQAPTRSAVPGDAIVGFAQALEFQLGHLGFAMRDEVASEARLRQFLPRLAGLLRERRVLLVLDNIETLMSTAGTWLDPMWGMLMAALTGHGGLSRVILTSRVRPPGLDPVHVHESPVNALSLAEAVVLAAELPHLGQLLQAEPVMPPGTVRLDPDPDLARRVLSVVQGHPKLLELADAAAVQPDRLRERLSVAAQAVPDARLGAFFGTGESALAGAEHLDVLTAWTRAAVRDLPPEARTLVELLACLEDSDRAAFVVENVWPVVWQRRDRTEAPSWEAAAELLRSAALVEPVDPEDDGAGSGFAVHPGVAEAVRSGTDPGWRTAVDEVLAAFWVVAYRQGLDAEGRGVAGATGVVVAAGLAGAQYLLRLGRWGDANVLLENAAQRDEAPGTTRRVLGLLLRVLEGETDPARRLVGQGVYAWLLGRVDPDAARAGLVAVRDAARERGDYRLGASVAGHLVDQLRRHGLLVDALAAIDEQVALARAAGLGPWSQVVVEGQRLQVLSAMGRHREVAEEAQALLAHLDSLPVERGADEIAVPWNVRETVLDIARRAARELGEWQQALDLNRAILDSVRARGAGVHEVAWTRFNDYFELLELGRLGEAERLLLDCQQVYTDTGDVIRLGRVFSARADVEWRRGRAGEAVTFEHHALRYRYQLPQPADVAVSHHNLANYLAATGQDPVAALAHHLAAGLLHRATGRTTGLASTVRAVAADQLDYPDISPPDLATLVATVERVSGVRFAALLAALVPDPATQQQMLAEILDLVNTDDAVARHVEQWVPVFDAIVAVIGGGQAEAETVNAELDEIGTNANWAALVSVLKRILAGERGEALTEGLDRVDTAIVQALLARL